ICDHARAVSPYLDEITSCCRPPEDATRSRAKPPGGRSPSRCDQDWECIGLKNEESASGQVGIFFSATIAAGIIDDTNGRGFLRYIECGNGRHGASPFIAE